MSRYLRAMTSSIAGRAGLLVHQVCAGLVVGVGLSHALLFAVRVSDGDVTTDECQRGEGRWGNISRSPEDHSTSVGDDSRVCGSGYRAHRARTANGSGLTPDVHAWSPPLQGVSHMVSAPSKDFQKRRREVKSECHLDGI